MLTNKQKTTLITAWSTFSYHLGNLDWTSYAGELLVMTRLESKRHDSSRPDSVQRGLTLDQEAKYFALLRFAQYAIAKHKAPEASDFLMLQRSVFAAYSLATNERFAKARELILADCGEELKAILDWKYEEIA